jgi:serine/threonine protein phosphatase PrpC
MKILPGNAQNIGRRKDQQDASWFSDIDNAAFVAHGGVLAIVADGMGGLEKGGEASHLAARAFGQRYLAKPASQSIPGALREALDAANDAVCALSRSVDDCNNVGTTLVAAAIARDALHWVSVGDSRLYLFRRGELTQLTSDHNYSEVLQREVSSGRMSPEEALRHPDRNALTSYLGMPDLEEIDSNLRPFPLEPGDWILLCSDGLHGVLSEREIAAELHGNPQEAADRLIQQTLARQHPNQDNTTVAIMSYTPAGVAKIRTGHGGMLPLGAWPRIPLLPRSRRLAWLAIGALVVLLLGVGYWGTRHFARPGGTTPQATPLPLPGQPAAPVSRDSRGQPAAAGQPVRQRIEELLVQAEQDIEKSRLASPPGENAFDKYNEVLRLDPNNGAARQGIERIGRKYIALALIEIGNGNCDIAEKYIRNVPKYITWHTAELDDARSNLNTAKQKGACSRPASPARPAATPDTENPRAEKPDKGIRPTMEKKPGGEGAPKPADEPHRDGTPSPQPQPHPIPPHGPKTGGTPGGGTEAPQAPEAKP